jgi:hypothetical protein
LGNQKPKVLVHIELRLWEALLSIASGKASVYRSMKDFFSSVPWSEIAEVSQLDRHFFKPGMGSYFFRSVYLCPSDAAKSSSKISILNVENESSLNNEWLLAQLRPCFNVLPPLPAPTDQAPTAPTSATQQDDTDTIDRMPHSRPSQQHEPNNMDTDKTPPTPLSPTAQPDGVNNIDDLLAGLLPMPPLLSEDSDSQGPSPPQQRASSGSAKNPDNKTVDVLSLPPSEDTADVMNVDKTQADKLSERNQPVDNPSLLPLEDAAVVLSRSPEGGETEEVEQELELEEDALKSATRCSRRRGKPVTSTRVHAESTSSSYSKSSSSGKLASHQKRRRTKSQAEAAPTLTPNKRQRRELEGGNNREQAIDLEKYLLAWEPEEDAVSFVSGFISNRRPS